MFQTLELIQWPGVSLAVTTPGVVVFSAPPTSNPSYDKDVGRAASKEWTGKGQFVFTASGGVYSENKGGTVDETSEVKATTERSTVLLAAEKVRPCPRSLYL